MAAPRRFGESEAHRSRAGDGLVSGCCHCGERTRESFGSSRRGRENGERMDQAEPIDDEGTVDTRPEIEIEHGSGNRELLERAARIRERSRELIDTLGEDHPLVSQALQRAAALERKALHPDRIDLR